MIGRRVTAASGQDSEVRREPKGACLGAHGRILIKAVSVARRNTMARDGRAYGCWVRGCVRPK